MVGEKKPRLLDLFCGAGGAAMGYHRAGFEVVGVDIKPQKNYPFEFHQADAMTYPLDGFDVIHASPPCQRFCRGSHGREKYPDLIDRTRKLIIGNGAPWIIENVSGAPVRPDISICGCMVGLPMIRRVRHFETSWPSFGLLPKCQHKGPVICVTGQGTPSGTRAALGRNVLTAEMRQVMGIDWTTRKELSQAIPPAYTEWIGKQLMEYLTRDRGM